MQQMKLSLRVCLRKILKIRRTHRVEKIGRLNKRTCLLKINLMEGMAIQSGRVEKGGIQMVRDVRMVKEFKMRDLHKEEGD